ncbi:hypothetical protein BDN72DRAFT_768010 [Pluteus cervinus]|uniref:Uncharacterized protein n=1 Tax=Pluteus cervinus TaxID=181527 RepID=A0ACD3AUB7_9AGAR|nr:hypothetical protein BDN72DRAFT_768010 [Pluteus cervinus]
MHDELLSCMGPVDLLRYGRSSREHQRLVKDFIQREFVLEKLLGSFITEQELPYFRKIHQGSQFLISGSTALQFFTQIRYPDSDLDLYIEDGRSHALLLWLESIGYIEKRRTIADDFEWNAYAEVPGGPYEDDDPVILKVVTYERNGRQVQVICTANTPLQLILDFPLTCVMNFITATTAYSLYPWATFEKKLALETRRGKQCEAFKAKYVARGWTVVKSINKDDEASNRSDFFMHQEEGYTRYVGDRLCWVVDGVYRGQTENSVKGAYHPVNFNSWSLVQPSKPYHEFEIFRCDELALSYVIYGGHRLLSLLRYISGNAR